MHKAIKRGEANMLPLSNIQGFEYHAKMTDITLAAVYESSNAYLFPKTIETMFTQKKS